MINIGIIGVGIYGINHIIALMQREKIHRDVKLVGFAEIDEKKREEIQETYGIPGFSDYQKMIDSIPLDAVTVVTPDHLHFEIVMECLRRGIPVLVEKPLSTSLQESMEMAEAAKTRNLLLQVDFHKRFDPYHIDLKLRIQDGSLGDIQYGYCWMEDILTVGTTMIGKKSWGDKGSPGWFLATHMIDLSYWLLGFPKPKTVRAFGFKGKLTSLGLDIFDSIKTEVEYENGVVITYDTSVILPNSHESIVRQGIKLVGTEGFMEVDSQYRGARGCSQKSGMETPNLGMRYRDFDKKGNLIFKGYFSESICDFVENLNYLAEGHSLNDLEGKYASASQGVDITKIGVGMHESIKQGGKVIEIANW